LSTVIRVILDTNTLIAARWKPASASASLLELCLDGTLQPILTEAIDAENRHILRKVRPPPAFLEKIDALGGRAEWVEPREGITVCEDPDDDKFIAGALGGGADVIISSDRHLLDQNGYENLRICSAGTFLAGISRAPSQREGGR